MGWTNIFIKSYNDDSNGTCFLEFNVPYFEILHNVHEDLAFVPENIKIEKGKIFAVDMLYV